MSQLTRAMTASWRTCLLMAGGVTVVACIQLPTPLGERIDPTVGSGGFGGSVQTVGGNGPAATGGQGTTSQGGSADGGAGGQGGGAAQGGSSAGGGSPGPLLICKAGQQSGCANVVQFALGAYHSCLLASDGHVWCWGSNLSGQIGPNVPTESGVEPTLVAGIDNIDELVAGDDFNCARMGGQVSCWGRNDRGQLGVGDTQMHAGAVALNLPPVAGLAADDHKACAYLADGSVYCWGELLNGQAWFDTQHDPTPSLVAGLAGLGPLADVVVGINAGCALAADHSEVRCWGGAPPGHPIGDGTNQIRLAAVSITGLPAPIDAITGREVWCGVADGAVRCWGDLNSYGKPTYASPVVYPGIDASDVGELDTGWKHSCFLRNDKTAMCMGRSQFGQVGPVGGTGEPMALPVAVTGSVELLGVGNSHNCIVRTDNEVRCWGHNFGGQITPSSTETVFRNPQTVDFSP